VEKNGQNPVDPVIIKAKWFSDNIIVIQKPSPSPGGSGNSDALSSGEMVGVKAKKNRKPLWLKTPPDDKSSG